MSVPLLVLDGTHSIFKKDISDFLDEQAENTQFTICEEENIFRNDTIPIDLLEIQVIKKSDVYSGLRLDFIRQKPGAFKGNFYEIGNRIEEIIHETFKPIDSVQNKITYFVTHFMHSCTNFSIRFPGVHLNYLNKFTLLGILKEDPILIDLLKQIDYIFDCDGSFENKSPHGFILKKDINVPKNSLATIRCVTTIERGIDGDVIKIADENLEELGSPFKELSLVYEGDDVLIERVKYN